MPDRIDHLTQHGIGTHKARRSTALKGQSAGNLRPAIARPAKQLLVCEFDLVEYDFLEMMLAGNEFDGLDTHTGLRALDHELAEAAMALCGFTHAATYPSGV